ncbi:MAG: hypothetical protein IJ813_06990 [Bacteroidales bacterium]|nr:hypothetical protein [Bacteroidales bacterium]
MDSIKTTPIEPLTERETDILRRIAAGHSTARIASDLDLSPTTIMWYRKRLHLKFDVHSAVELVRLALEQKII